MDSNFIGFIGIAIGIFLGFIGIAFAIFFGLAGFRKGVTSELSAIKEAVIAIRTTVDKTWDLVVVRFGESHGTVVRELENLGKVTITAEPGKDETSYLIEIEKPILREGILLKRAQESDFQTERARILGKEAHVTVLSPNRMRFRLPNTNPKACTEFITFLLKWLNSTYVGSLKEIKEFEEPILS